MNFIPVLFLFGILFSSGIVVNVDGADAQVFPENYVSDRLLVKFNENISSHHKQGLLHQNNAIVTNEIPQIGILIINVPPQSLETVQSALQNNPVVDYVEKDWILEPTAIPNDSNFSNQWHLTKIGADQAWDEPNPGKKAAMKPTPEAAETALTVFLFEIVKGRERSCFGIIQ